MMATVTKADIAKLFKAAHFHRFEVFHSEQCACYACMKTFKPTAITEWTDKDMTALCPHCGQDAVLPDYKGTSIDQTTLQEMNRYAY